eukprot:5931446-Prymnesium_polylepis.1
MSEGRPRAHRGRVDARLLRAVDERAQLQRVDVRSQLRGDTQKEAAHIRGRPRTSEGGRAGA